MKSHSLVEYEIEETGFKMSRATEIPTRRIVATNENDHNDLRIWLDEEAFDSAPRELSSTGDTSTIWHKLKDFPCRPLLSWPKNQSLSQTVWYFGWYAAVPTEGIGMATEESVFWTSPINKSLLSLCSQETFGSFIASILDLVDDVGSIDIQETEMRNFGLKSNLLSEMVKIFTESQLGSRKDALLCILPSFIPRLKLPAVETTLKTATRSANQRRSRGEWSQAEVILKWAWRVCTSQPGTDKFIQHAATALGGLYRWALCGDGTTKQFGSLGIEWLTKQKDGCDRLLSEAVKEIVDRYIEIADKTLNGGREYKVSDGRLPSAMEDGLTATLIHLTLSVPMAAEEKREALYLAVEKGWAEVVFVLLELGTKPDKYRDNDYRTALSIAAQNGRVDLVELLMEWRAFPNSPAASGRTPLSYASSQGHESVVRLLLKTSGVDPITKDGKGMTALSWALEGNNTEVIKLLLEDGRVNQEDGTPLVSAARSGNKEIVKLLLKTGVVDPNKKGSYGRIALILAAKHDNHEEVNLLLEDDRVDQKDGMPLALAATSGQGDSQDAASSWCCGPERKRQRRTYSTSIGGTK